MTIRNYSEMRFERSRDEIKSEFIYLETDKRKVDDVDLTLEITLISAGVSHAVIVRNRLQRLSVRGYEISLMQRRTRSATTYKPIAVSNRKH